MTLPLTGLRVLDLSRVLSGPYCTMLLADMGAEVIKVEVPGEGDLTRGKGDPESEARGGQPVFFDLNRNKQSLTLNLKAEAGKEIFQALGGDRGCAGGELPAGCHGPAGVGVHGPQTDQSPVNLLRYLRIWEDWAIQSLAGLRPNRPGDVRADERHWRSP